MSIAEITKMFRDEQLKKNNFNINQWAYSVDGCNFFIVGEEKALKSAKLVGEEFGIGHVLMVRARINKQATEEDIEDFKVPFYVAEATKQEVVLDVKRKRIRERF